MFFNIEDKNELISNLMIVKEAYKRKTDKLEEKIKIMELEIDDYDQYATILKTELKEKDDIIQELEGTIIALREEVKRKNKKS